MERDLGRGGGEGQPGRIHTTEESCGGSKPLYLSLIGIRGRGGVGFKLDPEGTMGELRMMGGVNLPWVVLEVFDSSRFRLISIKIQNSLPLAWRVGFRVQRRLPFRRRG